MSSQMKLPPSPLPPPHATRFFHSVKMGASTVDPTTTDPPEICVSSSDRRLTRQSGLLQYPVSRSKEDEARNWLLESLRKNTESSPPSPKTRKTARPNNLL